MEKGEGMGGEGKEEREEGIGRGPQYAKNDPSSDGWLRACIYIHEISHKCNFSKPENGYVTKIDTGRKFKIATCNGCISVASPHIRTKFAKGTKHGVHKMQCK